MLKFVALVLLPAVFARRAFPIGKDGEIEDLFKKINPRIKWDDTNYLEDEAGPYAVCENARRSGTLTITQKSVYAKRYGANGVGGLVGGTRTTGTTVSGASRDITNIMRSWIEVSPFRDQITEATSFGCSVEPGCSNGKTIVVCLFTPRLSLSGDGGNGKDENIHIDAVAYTEDEYLITERAFRRLNPSLKWDRSHFLENLSGSQTKCAMIGRNTWNAKKAQDIAKTMKGFTTAFIFGEVDRRGNTDDAVRRLAEQWSKTQWSTMRRAKSLGCSLAMGCRDLARRRSDVLVASCLVKL